LDARLRISSNASTGDSAGGSRKTNHRDLKEIEETEGGRAEGQLQLSEQLVSLVSHLADQLGEEAEASIAQEREHLARERLDYQNQIRQAEAHIQQLESQSARLAEQLNVAQQALNQAQHQHQLAQLDYVRLTQANDDKDARLAALSVLPGRSGLPAQSL